nr:MAG TPA: hypothetical protein [Caudoviricetes sp.]
MGKKTSIPFYHRLRIRKFREGGPQGLLARCNIDNLCPYSLHIFGRFMMQN